MAPWPIYLINLDRAADRLAASLHVLERAGLAAMRISAVDGRSLPDDVIAAYRQASAGKAKRMMTAGEVGCALSHFKVWSMIAAGDAAGGIVLEDDMDLVPDAAPLLTAATTMASGFDMLKLTDGRELRPARPTDRLRLTRPAVLPMSTLAYAITRPAAAAMMGLTVPLSRPIDLALKHWWAHGAAIAVADPLIAGRRADHAATSGIEADRLAQRGSAIGRLGRNLSYQLRFRWALMRAGAPPEGPRWPMEQA